MIHKGVDFDNIFDKFAIRIIVNSPFETEKADCWKIYSIVTDFYKPNPDRLRDWVSTPKVNGYESLHTTVMGDNGKWVEVQIRSKRMDEIAEKGYAAHWKYKQEGSKENSLDAWIDKIRELLQNPESNAVDFIDDFKLDLYFGEIYIFTPNGDLKTLPKGSTALDVFTLSIKSLSSECPTKLLVKLNSVLSVTLVLLVVMNSVKVVLPWRRRGILLEVFVLPLVLVLETTFVCSTHLAPVDSTLLLLT